ncbi:MAG TPA: FkbM family methyltransferase [Acidimicrobiales bacterium]|nr:FkbM family methyltransferase [Acidimicrobiales bacterium]
MTTPRPKGYLRRRVAMIPKSLSQDRDLLGLRSLPPATRAGLVAQKYVCLLRLLRGGAPAMRVGAARVGVHNVFEVGTLISSIVDVSVLAESVGAGWSGPSAAPSIVDVGANIGQFCAAAKLFWPEAAVVCFEPDPDVAVALRSNVGGLDGVTIRQVGLGAEAAELTWHKHKLSAMSSFRPRSDDGGLDHESPRVELPVHRLDDELVDVARIDLLKVDVEGFELEVLRGAPATLARAGALLVEATLTSAEGASNLEVFSLVHEAVPSARIVGVGRVYGPQSAPICVDVLISLS